MQSFTLPKTDLEKFLRATIAHLPSEFEITAIAIRGPRSAFVRFEIEPCERRAEPQTLVSQTPAKTRKAVAVHPEACQTGAVESV